MRRHRFASAMRLGFGAALLLLGARASSATVSLSAPIEVPSLPGYDGAHDEGTLAVLDDGSFALGRRTYSVGFELLVYGPDGTLLATPVVAIAPRTGGITGGVGPFGDRFFVTWSFPASRKAYAAFYSRQGELLGQAFRWPYSDTLRPFLSFHYARGPRGRVLPFFSFQFGLDRFGYPDYASWSRVFGPEGKFLGKTVKLLTDRHVLRVEDAALNEEGRFVVAFQRCPRDPFSHQPCTRGLQRFDGAWRPRSPLRSDGLPPVTDRFGSVSLGLARTGDFLAGWVEAFGSPPDFEVRVFARIFRRDGSPAGQVLRLNGPGSQSSGQLRVRATHARTFVVGWLDSPGLETDVYLREVDGRTGRAGERILIASVGSPPDAASRLYAFELELNSSGRGVVWYGDFVRLVTVEPEVDEAVATIEEDHP
jgi:hypothetical protein